MVEDPGDTGECRQRALGLLARRTHFSTELEVKLRQRGFDEQTVEQVIGGLERDALIDDYQAGVEFVETRLRRKPLGPLRVRAELARRGLERDLVDRVLAAAYPPDQEPLARRALGPDPGVDRAATARRLGRLGFSSSVIAALLREIGDPETADP